MRIRYPMPRLFRMYATIVQRLGWKWCIPYIALVLGTLVAAYIHFDPRTVYPSMTISVLFKLGLLAQLSLPFALCFWLVPLLLFVKFSQSPQVVPVRYRC
jgi:hypothetical protein